MQWFFLKLPWDNKGHLEKELGSKVLSFSCKFREVGSKGEREEGKKREREEVTNIKRL